MPKIKTVELTAEQQAALEKGANYSPAPSFRLRCQALLLKNQKRSSLEVAQELGCCEMAVNNWVNRFLEGGVDALRTRQGRGRRAILQPTDLEAVRQAVTKNRQKVSLAKVELEAELGKTFSTLTLKRYLKKTVAASNECDGA